jgi:hypothetical protein
MVFYEIFFQLFILLMQLLIIYQIFIFNKIICFLLLLHAIDRFYLNYYNVFNYWFLNSNFNYFL